MLAFDPQLPLALIAALAALALLGVGLAAWRGLRGWWLRALAALVLLATLAGPSLRQEDRAPVANIALVVADDSASDRIDGRDAQVAEALEGIEARLDRLGEAGGLEVRTLRVADRGEDGTQLLTALAEATAELPADRIAGAILITDGQVHDPQALTEFPAPVHVLLTGSAEDWDRRVVIETAPAFAIVDEAVSLRLRVEDLGAAPGEASFAPLSIALDGAEPLHFEVPVNRSVDAAGDAAAGRHQRAADLDARGGGRADPAQQRRHRLDQRRARPAAGAAGLRRALSGRAHLAEPAEVRQRRRPRALHHPAPAREAGLRAGLRALADRLPDPGALHGEGRRVRPDHLRPLQAPRHPAEPLLREHRPLRARRRGAADRERAPTSPAPRASTARRCAR